jgi:hypothetical protein
MITIVAELWCIAQQGVASNATGVAPDSSNKRKRNEISCVCQYDTYTITTNQRTAARNG